ncbi:MAG: S-layer homology domain-containing protein [Peptococcaceae bacterium]|nr:S-layer homology domain-containing protein [Peptococcaceae bacterium]
MKKNSKFIKVAVSLSFILLLCITVSLGPAPARADTVDDAVGLMQEVYKYLDDADKAAIDQAKSNIKNLDRDPAKNPWPGVFKKLLTDKVKARLGGEDQAKTKIINFICDLGAIQYSTDAAQLKSSLIAFKAKHSSTVTDLFGDFTINDLYGYLMSAKSKAPDVLSSLSLPDLMNIASGNYGSIRPSLIAWTKDSLEIADDPKGFKSKLKSVDWSIGKLVDAKDCVSAVADPGYKAEIALAKAWVLLVKKGVTFSDISGHWAQMDIEYMANSGYITGVGEGLFAPDAAITRAQFTALLVNVLKLDGEADIPFTDVQPGAWYSGSVARAYAAGLVGGVGAGSFAPEDPITREQMAAMICNALRHKGLLVEVTDVEGKLALFADQSSISGWARIPITRAVSYGIIKGKPLDGTVVFAPLDRATRAEAAVTLKRFIEQMK